MTMRQRIWMLPAGGGAADVEDEGSPEVVAESLRSSWSCLILMS